MVHLSLLPYLRLVFTNNHTSVFGSWFRNGKWGHACCHQIHKNSYCTGAQGIEADQAAYRLARGEIDDMPPPAPPKKQVKQVVDAGQIRDGIKEGMKRKRPDDGGFQLEGRTMTVAESATMSEQEYEDYRKNKMPRSDDPLVAMQALEGSV
jgi:pre-mRNA-processing factor SLU7